MRSDKNRSAKTSMRIQIRTGKALTRDSQTHARAVVRNSQFVTRNRLSGITVRKGQAIRRDRWAIILAGGDGTRLRSYTRNLTGDDRPKQFCALLRNETLLDQTRRRVALQIAPSQVMFSFTETHRNFFNPLVRDVAKENLVVQPKNLGTAPAILYSLMRLSVVDPTATVAFFPSDHHFADDPGFMTHVDRAFRAVKARPEMVVLLGIEADRPEVEYGWIEPAQSLFASLPGSIRRVQRFWEKPSADVARELLHQGFLWNSFVMVGRVDRFLELVKGALPELFAAFAAIKLQLGTPDEVVAVEKLYSQIQPANFSHEVLSVKPDALSVMAVRNAGWSDLGDPGRVLATLQRLGEANFGTPTLAA